MIKLLTVSDKIVPLIHSSRIRERFGDIDLILSCGDLPYTYLEYIITLLDKPLYYVRGNHDQDLDPQTINPPSSPLGGFDLHRSNRFQNGLLLAGVEGSIRYNQKTRFQYTQREMWSHVLSLVPGLFLNRFRQGRFLDIFVTHAPPRGIHEGKDWAHQGIRAFRWLLDVFQPRYHFHGHVHYYHPDTNTETRLGKTTVINTYRYRVIELPAVP